MKKSFFSTLLTGVLVASVSVASAQSDIIIDNFDSYADQAALTGVWTSDSAGFTLMTDGGHSGSNYVRTGVTLAGKFSQLITAVTPTDEAPVEVSAWVRPDTATSGRSYLQIEGASLNMANFGSYNTPGGSKWNYRAGAPGTWKNTDAPAQTADVWQHLKVVVRTNTATFYVNDVAFATETKASAFLPFTKFSIGFSGSSATLVDWDDVSVKTVSSVNDWNLY